MGDQVPFFYTLPQQTVSTNTVNTSVASLNQATTPVSALQSGQILVAQPSQVIIVMIRERLTLSLEHQAWNDSAVAYQYTSSPIINFELWPIDQPYLT